MGKRNFRIWIVGIGIVLLVAGFIIKQFGMPPCDSDGVQFFAPCQDMIWSIGSDLEGIGTIGIIFGSILLFVRFLVGRK